MNVDHEHFKITTVKGGKMEAVGWTAETIVRGEYMSDWGKTKTAAINNLKKIALRRSVRGLLCPGRYKGCNRLLGRVDSIKRLEGFLAYLKNPPAYKIIS